MRKEKPCRQRHRNSPSAQAVLQAIRNQSGYGKTRLQVQKESGLGIGRKAMEAQLKKLEQHNLIYSIKDPTSPKKKLYFPCLTPTTCNQN